MTSAFADLPILSGAGDDELARLYAGESLRQMRECRHPGYTDRAKYADSLALAAKALTYNSTCAGALVVNAAAYLESDQPLQAEQCARAAYTHCSFQDELISLNALEILTRARYAQNILKPHPARSTLLRGLYSDAQSLLANPRFIPLDRHAFLYMVMVLDFVSGSLENAYRLNDELSRYLGPLIPTGAPTWDGSNPSGKTILIQDHSGLGDHIQYLRYAQSIHQNGGTVIVEARERLLPLVRTARGVSKAYAQGSALPAHDFAIGILGLPVACGIRSPETIYWPGPYLRPELTKVEEWKSRLTPPQAGCINIGLCWASGGDTVRRLIPFQALSSWFSIPNTRWFSLQRGPNETDAIGAPIISLETPDTTIADTAAAIISLDLVISMDTMVCHLAGALGRPVWILLPKQHDVRWETEGETTAWSPTMTLFRQERVGEWDSLIQDIRDRLSRFAGQPRARE